MPDAVKWEPTACPVCRCADAGEFLRAPGDDGTEYRLARCRACELVFLDPRPTEDTVGLLYTEDYPQYRGAKLKTGPLRRLRAKLFGHRERSLADRIPVVPGGALLDYGCGAGQFVAQMRDRGWNAFGMDFSPHAVVAAREQYGVRAVCGTLPHTEVPPNSLDALTLRMVLEHVHDPAALLRHALVALKPGGALCVAVPNLAAWGFGAFGKAWFPLRLPWHLSHFTPDTLARTVRASGFEVETIATKGHTNWTGFSVRRARELNPKWWTPFARVRLVRSALSKWTERRGAGDELCLLARKPLRAALEVPTRRAA